MSFKIIGDHIDLLAHALVLLDELGYRRHATEQFAPQAHEQIRLCTRVVICYLKAAQHGDHVVERIARRTQILVAHALKHAVRDGGELLLRLAAEEDDRVGITEIDLLH